MSDRTNRRVRARWTWLPVGAVIVLVAVLVTIYSLSSTSPVSISSSRISTGAPPAAKSGARALPAGVLGAVSSVSLDTLAEVGIPQGLTAPSKVQGSPPLLTGPDGKLEVLYVGSEYCPFCAAQRWALVVALSHFGNFSALSATQSSKTDQYPATQTFSFYGSRYTSPSLDFVPVELQTNQAVGGVYPTLQRLTPAQESVLKTFDSAPYTDQPGSIPFIDIGNRFVTVGASYSPAVLAGLSMSQIAAALSHPNSVIAQAIDGTANVLIRAISSATGAAPTP